MNLLAAVRSLLRRPSVPASRPGLGQAAEPLAVAAYLATLAVAVGRMANLAVVLVRRSCSPSTLRGSGRRRALAQPRGRGRQQPAGGRTC